MNIIVAVMCAVCLAASVFGWKYADTIVRRHLSPLPLFLLFFCVTVCSSVAVRLLQNNYPADLAGAAILKFTASLPSVILALRGFLMERNKFDLMILLAVILCLCADVAINLSFAAGGAIFLTAHLLFFIAFVRERKPSRKQIYV